MAGGNSGIRVNASFASGLVGQAFAFAGQNSYVQIPSNAALAGITNALTLEAWVWHETGGGAYQRYVTISPQNALIQKANGRFDFFLAFAGGALVNLTSTNLVEDHRWYHVVGTYDGSAQRLYVNGELAGVAIADRALSLVPWGELYISISGQEMRGLIDEPAIYNRALTAEEIQSHFAAGASGMCKVPTFAGITLSFPGTAHLDVKGPPAKALEVQATSDLSTWLPFTTVSNFTGKARVLDPDAGTLRQSFYRLISP